MGFRAFFRFLAGFGGKIHVLGPFTAEFLHNGDLGWRLLGVRKLRKNFKLKDVGKA